MMKDEEPNVEYPFELPPNKGQQEINHLIDKGEMLYRVEEVLPEKVQPETQEVLDVLYNMEPWENIVQQRHAHWIEDDYAFNRCSNCSWEWDEAEYATPYCPNCGARMEPDEEEQE